MAGRVHPESAIEPLAEKDPKGREPYVIILNHGDAQIGKHPTVRIWTGHKSAPYKEYEVMRNSLGCLSYDSRLRKLALAIIECKWFDRFILLNIAAISLLSASFQNRAPEEEGFNLVSFYIEQVINGFFTLELLLKVAGWGLICHKGAYLRNPWNLLDFLVVLDANMQYIPNFSGGGFNFLRLFRALRPLRSLNAIPQMKVLVNTLMCSIPKLGNVTLMGGFLFLIFAIVGITLMDGVFYHRCRLTPNPVLDTAMGCWQWAYAEDDRLCGGRYSCPDGTYCKGHEEDPSEDLRPVFAGGRRDYPWCEGSAPTKLFPETDFIHFDHLGGAVLIVFQCMTLEGWTDIMYAVQDGYNELVATIFFCSMICVTSHFLLNVALAVVDEVRDNFDGEEEEEQAAAAQALAESEGTVEGSEPGKEPLWLDCAVVRFLHGIATSEIFLNIILMAIVGNVITMCLEKFPEEPEWKDAIFAAEMTFLVIFCVEMVIMLGALGPIKYIKNPVTLFDGVIVIVSVVQQALGQSGPLTALRTLRLFRVLNKLQDRWHSLKVLLKAMLYTGMALNYWLVLFVLVLYICTLMAMSFFNKKFHFNDPDAFDKVTNQDQAWCPGIQSLPPGQRSWHYWQDCIPRAHFDTFLWAFVTIFQIMTGENWNTVMYAGMRATNWAFVLFFWFLIIFGQVLFVSLFLSILTSKFQIVSKQIADEQAKELAKNRNQKKPNNRSSKLFQAIRNRNSVLMMNDLTGGSQENEWQPLRSNREDAALDEEPPRVSDLPGHVSEDKQDDQVLPLDLGDGEQPDAARVESEEALQSVDMTTQEDLPEGTTDPAQNAACCDTPTKPEKCCRNWPRGYAFFVCSLTNPIRRAARWIMTVEINIKGEKIKFFDNVVLLCILLSTVCMMVDFPLRNPDEMVTKVIRTADTVFAVIFIIEMVVKLVALGLVCSRDAYLRSGWNVLDGVVVIVSIIDMTSDNSAGFLKTLRILRALRPLRVISRNENLKVVVQTIFASVPDLAMLLVVISLFLLIFALVCVSYLKGQFYSCPMDGDGPVPALMRDIPNFRTPMCVSDVQPNATSPLGFDDHSIARQDGSWNVTSNSWEMSSCAGGSHPWARATIDTPICIGRCELFQSEERPQPPWLCPRRFTKTEELPPVGSCSTSRPLTPDEEIGDAYVKGMKRALVMPCGGSAVVNGAVDYDAGSAASCRAIFCPAGTISSDRQARCRSNCQKHSDFCIEACVGQDITASDSALTPSCASCMSECRAQCECEEFCEPLIKDAALCHEQGRAWSPTLSQSFDNIWTSGLTLFEIATTEGWVDVMYSATDSNGLYVQPKRDNMQWLWAPFFVFYIFFMTMFLINLSVGIIVERFIELKNTKGSSPMMTEAQEQWVRSKLLLYNKNQYFLLTNLQHLPKVRRRVYDFVSHKYFDRFIMGAIVFNTLLMSLKIFPSPSPWYRPFLQSFNYFFFGVFLLEAMLKLFAFRRRYFKDSWNFFDFICVMAGVISLAVRIFSSVDIVAVSGVVRIFRIARLFRLVRKFKEINKIFLALVLSLPKLFNVMAILLLVLTLYSILGVSLFSVAKKPPDGTLNVHGNFDNFWAAFITLFRASTGEAWNELMHDLINDEGSFFRSGEWCSPSDLFNPSSSYSALESKCLVEEPNACVQELFGRNIMPAIYWCSYIVVCLHLMMNLVIAVILDGYEEGRHTPPEKLHIELCMERWKKFDPDLTERVPLSKAMCFVNETCYEILKSQGKEDLEQFRVASSASHSGELDTAQMPMAFAKCFDLQLNAQGEVSFSSATRQVLRIVVLFDNNDAQQELEEVTSEMFKSSDTRTANRLRSMELRRTCGPGTTDIKTMIAAVKVQRQWRNRKAARAGNSSPGARESPAGGQPQDDDAFREDPDKEKDPLSHPARAG